jgi:hypothetical protein
MRIDPSTVESVITKAERAELAKIIRLRAKVARSAVAQRQAELLAEVEAQLSAVYSRDDDAWAEITQAAKLAVEQWERAAIVAALVGPPTGGRGKSGNPDFPYGTVTLARLGIVGLTRSDTVAHYRDAWCVGAGLPAPTLGDKVNVPDLDWPPNPTVGRGMDNDRREALMQAGRDAGMPTGSKVVDIASNPRAVMAAIKADPEVAAAASKALDERWEESRSGKREATRETPHDAAADTLALIVKLRAAHRALVDAMTLAQDVRGAAADKMREAVNVEVDWIRGACDVIVAGVNGGSIDDQLRELLDAETGS